MKSPYVSELEPNQIDHGELSGPLQGSPPEEDRRAVPFAAARRPHRRYRRQDVGQRRRGDGHLRARRFREGEGPAADLPEPAAVHHPQDAAAGRERGRLRRLLPLLRSAIPDEMLAELRGIVAASIAIRISRRLLEALLDDEEIAARYRRAPAAKQIHHAYLGGLLEHVLSLCALARMTAGHYTNVDLRPAADRRDAARHRQDLRAELRARLRLHATKASCSATS